MLKKPVQPQTPFKSWKINWKHSLVALVAGVVIVSIGIILSLIFQPKQVDFAQLVTKKSPTKLSTSSAKKAEDNKTTVTIEEEESGEVTITYPIKVPVLVLKYFPTSDGTTTLSGTITEMDKKTDNITKQLVNLLEQGSTYHRYKDTKAKPSLDYDVIKTKEFHKMVPLSTTYPERGDKFKMFSDSNIGVSNICDYVDNKGVKEVWIWMYHIEATKLGSLSIPKTGPTESNMAMGKISNDYWTGSFGDISNSYRVNDLPVCNHTYTVYEYNFGRQLSEATEDHMHHIEALLKYVDYNLFWGLFVEPYLTTSSYSNKIHSCGWSHYPPNGRKDYDWVNTQFVWSNCEDWKPDHTGKKQSFNCTKWDCNSAKFFKWWMQNLPGRDNKLTYKGKTLINWWDFIGDFDLAIGKGKSLTF